jgi:hypothetical protein
MRERIRNRIGQRVLKKHVLSRKKQREFLAFEDAGTLLISYAKQQPEQELHAIEQFAENLRKAGKKVTRLVFYGKVKKKAEKPADEKGVFYLFSDDFNLLGLPQSSRARKILSQPFDYLINLNPEGKTPLLSIAGLSSAAMRIGWFNERNIPYFDMLLGNAERYDFQQFLKDIDHYLRQIKK